MPQEGETRIVWGKNHRQYSRQRWSKAEQRWIHKKWKTLTCNVTNLWLVGPKERSDQV